MAHDVEAEIQRFVDAARHYQQCLGAEGQSHSQSQFSHRSDARDQEVKAVMVSENLRGSRRTLLETIDRWRNLVASPTEHWEQTTINVSDNFAILAVNTVIL